jgi:branched-chain amino acid transport system permease protein
MTWPSATLLAQSVLSGVFVGALYGLLGLGLSLSWGLLKLINLAHFGFAFLAAYLCYQMASMGIDPLLTLLVIVPCSSRSAPRCTRRWRAFRSRPSTRCC